MAYSSIAVANFFVQKAIEAKATDLSPMKLQKLVYFAHGWYLALNKKPLLTDRIEAWQYGPVISTLYHETKKWGNSSINSQIQLFDYSRLQYFTPTVDDQETIEFLDSIWKAYAKHSAIKLSNATHLEGSPWDKTIKTNEGNIGRNTIIDDKVIEEYFSQIALTNA